MSQTHHPIQKRSILILIILLLGFYLQLSYQPKIAQAQWTGTTDIHNTNAGNVGIGTDTPAEKLDVRGNLNLGAVGLTSTLKIYSSAAGGTGSYGRILTRPSGGLEVIGGGGSAATENAFYVTAHGYPGADNTYSLGSTSLRWSNLQVGTGDSSFGGNLKIGGTNPLTLRKSAVKTVDFNMTNEGSAGHAFRIGLGGWGADYFSIENSVHDTIYHKFTANGNSFLNAIGGNVGIGTTTPNAKLDVFGSSGDIIARVGDTDAGTGRLKLGWENSNSRSVISAWSNTGYKNMTIDAANLALQSNSNGKVGIGTLTPQTKLHIYGTDYPWFMLDGNGASGQSFISMRARTDASPNSEIYFHSGGSLIINSQAYANRGTPSGEVPRFTITGSGLVGIGTASPTAKLDVVGLNNGSSVRFTANTNADVAGAVFTVPGVTNWSLGNRPSGAFVLNNGNIFAGTDLITVLPGGNVGIGTTAPANTLHLDTSAGPVIRFTRTGFPSAFKIDTDGSSGAIATDTAHPLLFRTSSVERMRIDPNGNVGIGTAAPDSGSKLTVNGNVTVTGNIAAKYQDVAEWVTSPKAMPAGTVVMLHPDQTNQVLPSMKAYDTRVAGVVSDMPGLLLGEAGDGKVKVATTGRVKVKVDATKKPVQVGDLLVTSDKEGVAMKSEPMEINGRSFHQPGTILGKALEPLKSGEGEVLVLLSLQ